MLADAAGRLLILAAAAYIGYWALAGRSSEVQRAVKIIYYLLNIVEAVKQQHGL